MIINFHQSEHSITLCQILTGIFCVCCDCVNVNPCLPVIKVCLRSFGATRSWSQWMTVGRRWRSTATSTGWCWTMQTLWWLTPRRGCRSKSTSFSGFHLCKWYEGLIDGNCTVFYLFFCCQRGNEVASVGRWLAGPSHLSQRVPNQWGGPGFLWLHRPRRQIRHVRRFLCQIRRRCGHVSYLQKAEKPVSCTEFVWFWKYSQ